MVTTPDTSPPAAPGTAHEAHAEALRAARAATRQPSAAGAAKLAGQGKLPVRERISLLVDDGSFVEDGQLANALAGLPADGVVTGRGTVDGRPAIVIANDPTVKAGSWGARTVEKIVRATEAALRGSCRCSGSSTPPAPGSPTRSSSSRAGAA